MYGGRADRALVPPRRFGDYATWVEQEKVGRANTSYGYDDMAHFREMTPQSARAADMVYEVSGGEKATFAQAGNHRLDGWNVLYRDGHIAFQDSADVSSDPTDPIFQVSSDGGSADAVIARTHCNPLAPNAKARSDRKWEKAEE